MRRFFLQNIFFVLLVNVLVKPVWIFFIDRTVQNKLGAAEYGSYIALVNLALILQIVLDFGLSSYNTRIISAQPTLLQKMFPNMFWAKIILSVVYGTVVLVIGLGMGYRTEQLSLLAAVMLIQVFNSMVQLVRSSIVGLHRYKADALFSAMDKLLMILVCGGIFLIPFLANKFSIWWFVWAQQLSYALTFLSALILLKRVYPLPLHFRINVREIFQVFRSSMPYALLIFLMAAYIRMDVLMLERWLMQGSREAGLYGAAFRLLDAVNILGLSIAGILLPLFGKMNARGQSFKSVLQMTSNFMLPVAYTVAAISFFYGQDIMEFLMHETETYSGSILALLMLSFPAYCLMYIFSTLLTAIGALRELIIFAGMALLINFLGNYWAIPRQGAVGAAWVASVTQWSIALLCVASCVRRFKLKWSDSLVVKHLLFAAILFTSAFALRESSLNWVSSAVIIFLVSGACFVLFQFFELKEWKQLLQMRKS